MEDAMTASIDAFWQWWPMASERLRAAIENRAWEETLVDEVNQRVQDIDERLAWIACPGERARHAFCLSAAGDPALRVLTEKWLAGGPVEDSLWEFHPARRATP